MKFSRAQRLIQRASALKIEKNARNLENPFHQIKNMLSGLSLQQKDELVALLGGITNNEVQLMKDQFNQFISQNY